jgi:hypothetical protein
VIGREIFVPHESKGLAGTALFLVYRCGNFCDPGAVNWSTGCDPGRARRMLETTM